MTSSSRGASPEEEVADGAADEGEVGAPACELQQLAPAGMGGETLDEGEALLARTPLLGHGGAHRGPPQETRTGMPAAARWDLACARVKRP